MNGPNVCRAYASFFRYLSLSPSFPLSLPLCYAFRMQKGTRALQNKKWMKKVQYIFVIVINFVGLLNGYFCVCFLLWTFFYSISTKYLCDSFPHQFVRNWRFRIRWPMKSFRFQKYLLYVIAHHKFNNYNKYCYDDVIATTIKLWRNGIELKCGCSMIEANWQTNSI